MQQRRSNARKVAVATPAVVAVEDDASSLTTPSKTKRDNNGKEKMNTNPSLTWILVFAMFVVWCVGAWRYLIHWEHKQEVLFEQRLKRELDPMTKEWEEQVLALQLEKEDLEQASQISEARKEAEQMQLEGGISGRSVEKDEEQQQLTMEQRATIDHLTKHVQHLKDYKERMHKAIQHISKTEVLEKFGPGPHRVEMLLAFHPDEPGTGDAHRIVLELAPVDDMPHANYWFLSQVDKKLWNGCSFHRNAAHVLQSGWAANFLTNPDTDHKARDFKDARFDSILFQEYSPTFSHKKLTVGYAGRPGGPDFYISTMDNSINHGPGGQTAYDDVGEADPCFAKVVEGEDAVSRMHALKAHKDDFEGLVHHVAITEMRILKPAE